jgi:hypothetical protein
MFKRTSKVDLGKCNFAVTIIKSDRTDAWEVYESPGVQPVFLNQEQAIDYAKDRGFSIQQVAIKCLKKGDWLLDHIEGELAFMRGLDLLG